ncbi:MAG TPA: cyclase [Planctomycetaceae bacterium]|nr:cyclase [Planctomycetaceae bacterium]
MVDLSLPINDEMPGVNISTARTLEDDGWNATTLQLYSHCGTHMDAPCHFLPSGATIDQQDLSICVGPAEVLNLAPSTTSQLIDVADIEPFKNRIDPGSRLLLRTDWHKKYPSPEYRSGLPRISLQLAEWFVETGVAMIGVEGPSVADVNNMEELTAVHQTLFRGNVLIVEALAHLDQLTQNTVQFIGLPLKVTGGDGTPIRAIAIEDD